MDAVGEVQGFKPEPLKVIFYSVSLVWKEGTAAAPLFGTLFGRHVLAILAAVLNAGPACCAYGLEVAEERFHDRCPDDHSRYSHQFVCKRGRGAVSLCAYRRTFPCSSQQAGVD